MEDSFPYEEFEQEEVKQEEPQVCVKCRKFISPLDPMVFLQSTECFHTLHHKCFSTLASESSKGEGIMKCPECRALVSEFEMR